MSKFIVVAAFLCTGLVVACGGGDGGSGVSGSKRIVSLGDGEVTDLCEYLIDVAGPEREIDCGGGLTITVGGGTLAECTTDLKMSQTQFPNCTATVSNAEACAEDLSDLSDQQLCADEFPASCVVVFSVACGGV